MGTGAALAGAVAGDELRGPPSEGGASPDRVRAAGYVDVSTALQFEVPGLFVSPGSGPFDYVDVSLQGSRPGDVLWLVDGVRISSLSSEPNFQNAFAEIDEETAIALYVGLITDTGGPSSGLRGAAEDGG